MHNYVINKNELAVQKCSLFNFESKGNQNSTGTWKQLYHCNPFNLNICMCSTDNLLFLFLPKVEFLEFNLRHGTL